MVLANEYLKAFDKFFIGRRDAYGIYKEDGTATVIKKPITNKVLEQHLNGEITIGSYYAYYIKGIWYCEWLCIDFDNHDIESVDLIKEKWNDKTIEIKNTLIKDYKIPINVICREFSGRGYHIWVKFASDTTLKRAFDFRESVRIFLKKKYDIEEEIFPKQATIDKNGYGNWVKLPGSNNRKNGEYCEILDNFDLLKQGEGYKIPEWIPKVSISSVKNPKTIHTNNKKVVIGKRDECFNWFLDHIRPCLKRIALDGSLTHNVDGDVGHYMNLSLCDTLIYLGAPDSIIHKAFITHPKYTYKKTQICINGARKNFKITHALIRCKKIEERGYCIDECRKR